MEDCWMFTVLWSYVAAHNVEELLGLECWSLTVLVQEEVAPLEEENLHHWILVWSSLVQKQPSLPLLLFTAERAAASIGAKKTGGLNKLDGNACDALAVMACGWRKSAGK
ncbi:hypothetical protein Peur_034736 [Populus x canadensis]